MVVVVETANDRGQAGGVSRRPTVEVGASEATRIANANPKQAGVIEGAWQDIEKPPSVTIT